MKTEKMKRGHTLHNMEDVTIENMCHGGFIEAANIELQKLFANCNDPQTDPAATRSLTMKVTIKPDQSRGAGEVTFGFSPKLAGVDLGSQTVHFLPSGDVVALMQDEQIEFETVTQPAAVPAAIQ